MWVWSAARERGQSQESNGREGNEHQPLGESSRAPAGASVGLGRGVLPQAGGRGWGGRGQGGGVGGWGEGGLARGGGPGLGSENLGWGSGERADHPGGETGVIKGSGELSRGGAP